jgi:hypothetical protein
LNILSEIQKFKSLRDKAEGQIEAYEIQKKDLAKKFNALSESCKQKYGYELNELEDTIKTDEETLENLVLQAQTKYQELTKPNE